ncbi:hypothetical protein [Helicobacter canis]|uniref:hypothetical protein n=1 Tax=Helicobacter canis TaxID=29419 RepID=UPI0026F19138|nr:hypothetical protein [Helicobacter canis]
MDSTLAVFWRYKWVFIVVFALVLGVGGVGILYKQRTAQNASLSAGDNYAFFILSKSATRSPSSQSAYFVSNRILNPLLSRLYAKPLENVSKEIAHIIQGKMWILAPAGYSMSYADVYWCVYPANSESQAKQVAQAVQKELDSAPEVQALVSSLSFLRDLQPQSDEVAAWRAGVDDILSNGFFIYSSPAKTYAKGFRDLSVLKEGVGSHYGGKSMWILLCVSGFVCAILAVFVAEFVRGVKSSRANNATR